MNEQILKLQEAAKAGGELKRQLMDAGSNLDRIVEVAKANGYSFTRGELEAAMQASRSSRRDLGDADLEGAVGGTGTSVQSVIGGDIFAVC